jgi:hypothetical protein
MNNLWRPAPKPPANLCETPETIRADFLLSASVRMASSIRVMTSDKLPLLLAAIALAAMAACQSATTTTTPTTTASASTVTDTFTGTIVQTTNASFPFTVSTTGTVQVMLTDVEPLTTMALGIAVGTWDGTTCTPGLATNDHAKSGVTALTGTAAAGSYCVQVSDSGNIPSDWTVAFTVQVTHS